MVIAAQIPPELLDAVDAFMAEKPPEFTRSDLVRLALSELLSSPPKLENYAPHEQIRWERGPQAPRFQPQR